MKVRHCALGIVFTFGLLQSSVVHAQRHRLLPGDEMPSIVGLGLDGKALTVSYGRSNKPTVIYVITPFSCWVVKNEANFAAIVKGAASRFDFVLLSPTLGANARLSEYVSNVSKSWSPRSVTVIKDISPELKADLNLGGYPETLVVGPDGKLIQDFKGAYVPASSSAVPDLIQRFFGVSLPGPTNNEGC